MKGRGHEQASVGSIFCPMPFLLDPVTFAEMTQRGLFSDLDWILANWGDNMAIYKSNHIFLTHSITEVSSECV